MEPAFRNTTDSKYSIQNPPVIDLWTQWKQTKCLVNDLSIKTMALQLSWLIKGTEVSQNDYIDIDMKYNTCTKKILELQAQWLVSPMSWEFWETALGQIQTLPLSPQLWPHLNEKIPQLQSTKDFTHDLQTFCIRDHRVKLTSNVKILQQRKRWEKSYWAASSLVVAPRTIKPCCLHQVSYTLVELPVAALDYGWALPPPHFPNMIAFHLLHFIHCQITSKRDLT